MSCPNCSCTQCQINNLNIEYEELWQNALRHANMPANSTEGIGDVLNREKHDYIHLGYQSAVVLDKFITLIRRIRP